MGKSNVTPNSSESKIDTEEMSASIRSILFTDYNTYRYWIVLILCSFMVYKFITNEFTIFWFLLTFILSIFSSILTDCLYYFYGICYYDPHATIVRGYSFSSFFNDTLHSVGLDYGFNFYNGNYKKSRSEAQIDKFKYAVKQLGIKEGDRVIDVGCGCGDWLYYLQNTMKCTVVGVNITDAQARQARKRGLRIFTTNWKDIKNKPEISNVLYKQFDVVTFWDTVEHYVPFGQGIWRRHVRSEIYQDMFELAKNLTDPNSRLQKVWISCLHMRYETMPSNWYKAVFCPRRKIEESEYKLKGHKKGKLDKDPILIKNPWTLKEAMWKWYSIYLLDKFHSGFYPSYYEDKGIFYDELVDNGKVKGYDLKWREDATYDYYMTSVLNPTHFGRHRFKLTFDRIVGILITVFIDPYWLHRLLWFTVEAWMEQFDSDDFQKSFVILWWLVLQIDNDNNNNNNNNNNNSNNNSNNRNGIDESKIIGNGTMNGH